MNTKKTSSLAISVLKVVGAAGLIGAAFIAPGVAKALPLFIDSERKKRTWYPAYLTRTVNRLTLRGCIHMVKNNGRIHYQLTEKGSELLARYVLRDLSLPRPRLWDQKWRILIFDIPETRKPTRENIRRSLQRLGLTRLQDSVWVYPYDCAEVLELLRTAYGARHDALYITAERFLGDRDLLIAYGLPFDED